jgi:hypothetical protein
VFSCKSGNQINDLVLESVGKQVAVGNAEEVLRSSVFISLVPTIEHEGDFLEGRCWRANEDLFMFWESSLLDVEGQDEVEELIRFATGDERTGTGHREEGLSDGNLLEDGTNLRSSSFEESLQEFTNEFEVVLSAVVIRIVLVSPIVDEFLEFGFVDLAVKDGKDGMQLVAVLLTQREGKIVDLRDGEEVEKVMLGSVLVNLSFPDVNILLQGLSFAREGMEWIGSGE